VIRELFHFRFTVNFRLIKDIFGMHIYITADSIINRKESSISSLSQWTIFGFIFIEQQRKFALFYTMTTGRQLWLIRWIVISQVKVLSKRSLLHGVDVIARNYKYMYRAVDYTVDYTVDEPPIANRAILLINSQYHSLPKQPFITEIVLWLIAHTTCCKRWIESFTSSLGYGMNCHY